MNRLASGTTFILVLIVGIALYGYQNNGFPYNPSALWDTLIFFVPLSVLSAIMVGFGFASNAQE